MNEYYDRDFWIQDLDIVVDHGLDIISFNEPPLQNMIVDEIVTRKMYQKMKKISQQKKFREDINVVLVQESGRYFIPGDRTAHREGLPIPEGSVKIMVASSTRKIMEDFRTRVEQ